MLAEPLPSTTVYPLRLSETEHLTSVYLDGQVRAISMPVFIDIHFRDSVLLSPNYFM